MQKMTGMQILKMGFVVAVDSGEMETKLKDALASLLWCYAHIPPVDLEI